MRAAKVDDNQRAVVRALRDLGASVQHLHTVAGGCPDILVGFRGHNMLFEIKDGNKPPSARSLTPGQEIWHRDWRGRAFVVSSPEEAIEKALAMSQGVAK